MSPHFTIVEGHIFGWAYWKNVKFLHWCFWQDEVVRIVDLPFFLYRFLFPSIVVSLGFLFDSLRVGPTQSNVRSALDVPPPPKIEFPVPCTQQLHSLHTPKTYYPVHNRVNDVQCHILLCKHSCLEPMLANTGWTVILRGVLYVKLCMWITIGVQ